MHNVLTINVPGINRHYHALTAKLKGEFVD
jgi:hypothetical protein